MSTSRVGLEMYRRVPDIDRLGIDVVEFQVHLTKISHDIVEELQRKGLSGEQINQCFVKTYHNDLGIKRYQPAVSSQKALYEIGDGDFWATPEGLAGLEAKPKLYKDLNEASEMAFRKVVIERLESLCEFRWINDGNYYSMYEEKNDERTI